MERKYKTKQREKIIEYLESNNSRHITADEIIEHFRILGDPVGKATVYRCLEALLSENIVRKYVVSERDSACYQYVEEKSECSNHYHMKCITCGSLFHLECEEVMELKEHILKHHNFQIDVCKTVLYGYCRKCMKESAI